MTLRNMFTQITEIMTQVPASRWDEEIVIEILPTLVSDAVYSCSSRIGHIARVKSFACPEVIVVQLAELGEAEVEVEEADHD